MKIKKVVKKEPVTRFELLLSEQELSCLIEAIDNSPPDDISGLDQAEQLELLAGLRAFLTKSRS